MRGAVDDRLAVLSVLSAGDLVAGDRPMRRIKGFVDEVLGEFDGELGAVCPVRGRPSVPPEVLLKASLVMAL